MVTASLAGGGNGMIAYLVKTFPKLSETFVLGEIVGLERADVKIAIFALARPDAATPAVEADVVRATVEYIPRGIATLVRALIQCVTHPVRALRTAQFARSTHPLEWKQLLPRALWLAARLQSRGVTHLHAHFAAEPADLAEIASRLAGIRYSISAHAKDIYLSNPSALTRKLGTAAFTVTCTEYNRRFLSGLAPNGATVARMYHGIALDRFAPCTEHAPTAAPLILAVGRLREKKGFPVLIDACAQLARDGLDFRCEIVGYGPEHDALNAMIAARGLQDRIQLLGALPHAAVIERYRAASVFVLPCQIAADGDRDGIPNVVLEAMAMALPVVTTDVSGIPEAVVDGENGLLVPPACAQSLARALQRVLADPALGARLGQAGRALVARRFAYDTNLQIVRDLFARVEAQRSAPLAAHAYGG